MGAMGTRDRLKRASEHASPEGGEERFHVSVGTVDLVLHYHLHQNNSAEKIPLQRRLPWMSFLRNLWPRTAALTGYPSPELVAATELSATTPH